MSDPKKHYAQEEGRHNTRSFRLNLSEEQLQSDTQTDLQAYAGTESTPRRTPSAESVTGTRAQQKEAAEHRKRNKLKAKKNKRIFTFTWLAMIVLVSLVLASYLIGGSNDFFGVDRIESTVEITIPENVTQEELTKLLYDSHAIEKPEFFTIYCMLTADIEAEFPAGTYQVPTNLDYEGLINSFSAGPDLGEEITITFREGLTLREMANLFESEGFHTADAFLEAFNSDAFDGYEDIANLPNVDKKYYKLEGYLFPDTYNFFENDTIESILNRFLNNFEAKITDEMRTDIAASGYTMDEIITMASIIQAEAANTDDMYRVSAVLHNRLESGASQDIYFLDCDSTLFYPYKRDTIPSDDFISDYSTYGPNGVNGLPAGAICNPGLDAIMAAIYPSTEDGYANAYYFCHAEDGTAYYAVTMDEHLVNQAAAGLL